MVLPHNGSEASYQQKKLRRVQVVFARKMEQRRVYMEDLRDYRRRKQKEIFIKLIESVGPKWYQVLSVSQRKGLDELAGNIYQDLLEGLPVRTEKTIRILGLFPCPKPLLLQTCIYHGRDDPKVFFSHLYQQLYDVPFDVILYKYSLNKKLILSAIFYLGLPNLIELLTEKFKPDPPIPVVKKKKRKPKVTPPESPYVQKIVACRKPKPKPKRPGPPPLPDLQTLNMPFEEKPRVYKPKEPPPPPPPQPKKRVPTAYCDKLAGIYRIEPYKAPTIPIGTQFNDKMRLGRKKNRLKTSKSSLIFLDKPQIGGTCCRREKKQKKPVMPTPGQVSCYFLVSGVSIINGRPVYVLGNICVLPPDGDIIHGGNRAIGDEFVNIHCGIRAHSPPPQPASCDCIKVWQEPVMDYLTKTKCKYGHNYDYGHEEEFPLDVPSFFEKPTSHGVFNFNYSRIYETRQPLLHIEKELKNTWETDSMLCPPEVAEEMKKSAMRKRDEDFSCLGDNPKLDDYLRCALRFMKEINLAACLPEVKRTPELREWMRKRLYGPLTPQQKRTLQRQSYIYWATLKSLENNSLGFVHTRRVTEFKGDSTWEFKSNLQKKFRKFYFQYKMELYKAQAHVNNLFWATMYQGQFPDETFRRTFFSYTSDRCEKMHIVRPYSRKEAEERALNIQMKRLCCPPDGIELIEQ